MALARRNLLETNNLLRYNWIIQVFNYFGGWVPKKLLQLELAIRTQFLTKFYRLPNQCKRCYPQKSEWGLLLSSSHSPFSISLNFRTWIIFNTRMNDALKAFWGISTTSLSVVKCWSILCYIEVYLVFKLTPFLSADEAGQRISLVIITTRGQLLWSQTWQMHSQKQ